MEIKVEMGLLRVDHLGEVLPAQLVAILKLAIIVGFLLYRIIGQVDKLVRNVVQGVLSTARPYVAILVAVALQIPIDTRQQAKAPKIELSAMHQQRVVYVLLDYEGPLAILLKGPTNDRLDLSQALYHGDALTSVRILSRLDNPGVLGDAILELDLFDGLFVVAVQLTAILLLQIHQLLLQLLAISLASGAAIFINIILLDCLLDALLGRPVAFLELVEVVFKLVILGIVHPMLRVESQREDFEWILSE